MNTYTHAVTAKPSAQPIPIQLEPITTEVVAIAIRQSQNAMFMIRAVVKHRRIPVRQPPTLPPKPDPEITPDITVIKRAIKVTRTSMLVGHSLAILVVFIIQLSTFIIRA